MAKVVKMSDHTHQRMINFLTKVYPYEKIFPRDGLKGFERFFSYRSFNECLNTVLDHAEAMIKKKGE